MNVNGSTAPTEKPTVGEQFQFALGEFIQARMKQMQRDGVDPAATTLNHAIQSVQFEALVQALITAALITRDQFQLAVVAAAMSMAERINNTGPTIITAAGPLH